MFNVCVSQMVFTSLLVGIGDLFMQLKIDNYAISCCDSETRTDLPYNYSPTNSKRHLDSIQIAAKRYASSSSSFISKTLVVQKEDRPKQITHLSQIDGQIHFIVPHASR